MEETDGTSESSVRYRAGPPPPIAWRRGALVVPVLAVVAWVLVAVFTPLTNGHDDAESAACRWMPLPWTVWAVSYGGLVAALASVVLRIVLARVARVRGWEQEASWEGRLSAGAVFVAGLALLATAGLVVLTHLESADITANLGKPMCEGLGLPTG